MSQNPFPYFKTSPEISQLTVTTIRDVDQRLVVRLHAWGDIMDPTRLARLIALDSEPDRQPERNLGMLLKLRAIKGLRLD